MLKPYEQYQITKYDWLATVPKHWEKHTIRSITKVSDKKNGSRKDLELLSVYREYGVIKKSSRDDNHNVESQDLSSYKYVGVNYLVMNKMKMWQGSLGVSQYEGIVSPAYIVCKVTKELHPSYLHYLLRSPLFKTFYNRISYGVRVGQWDMRYDNFKELELYLPPIDEQDQIVRYLDWKLSKINKLIRLKKKQIELLNEQKQAIINKAVAKGLDGSMDMKDSGVEWLGQVPKDWEGCRLKHCFTFRQSGAWGEEPSESSKNIKCVRVADFCYQNLTLKDKIETIRGYNQSQIDKLTLKYGNILIEKSGGGEKTPVGRAVIYEKNDTALYANFIDALGVKVGFDCKFITYLLSAMYSNKINVKYIKQTTGIQNIDITSYLAETIFLPTYSMQLKISHFIENKCKGLEVVIEKINNEINLITEYRTSLISSVATGKVDVCDIEIPEFEMEEEPTEENIDEENDESGELEEV